MATFSNQATNISTLGTYLSSLCEQIHPKSFALDSTCNNEEEEEERGKLPRKN